MIMSRSSREKTEGKKVMKLSSFVAILVGGCFGYWVALIVFSWLSQNFPGEDIGAAWGSRVAAAIALWKAIVEAIQSLKGAWAYSLRKRKNSITQRLCSDLLQYYLR